MIDQWRETARLINLDVPLWKAHLLDYCESAGMRFCVDFGTDNAVEKAREHWMRRGRRRKNRLAAPDATS